MTPARRRRPTGVAAILWLAPILLLLAAIASACLGRYPLSPLLIGRFLLAQIGLASIDPAQAHLVGAILMGARLPRIAAAILVGAGLSVSGVAYQGIFRNPLMSPGSLGVLSGAGFGAALGIILGLHGGAVQGSAFLGGLAAVACGVGVARLFGEGQIVMLLLGGLLSNALFAALLSVLKYVADPENQLPDIVFWLLGSLASVSFGQLAPIVLPLCVSVLLLSLAGPLLDAMAMGDDEAQTLGVPVVPIRYAVIALATVISAMTVSISGMVGWVGMVVPHLARLLVGPGHRALLPLSACLGPLFLLVCDGLARTVSVGEIPIGIFADLIGVVSFMLLLPRVRRGWS